MAGPTAPYLVEDPPLAKLLFADRRLAWLWLPVRLYLGWWWLSSALTKIANPAWMETGEALRGFWARAVQVPPPPAKPVIAVDWYRAFIQSLLDGGHHVWFAKLIAVGEMAIAVALVLGAFTGIAAFLGGFMNWNFVMAGTASSNALLFALATWLVLAWKTAGLIGLDRWILPLLGTPWKPGRAFSRPAPVASGARVT